MIPEWIQNIDWELLKEQKQTLLDILELEYFSETTNGQLEGIISLIDTLQDYATDELGIDEQIVFGNDKDN